jgi:hypothetical protein
VALNLLCKAGLVTTSNTGGLGVSAGARKGLFVLGGSVLAAVLGALGVGAVVTRRLLNQLPEPPKDDDEV